MSRLFATPTTQYLESATLPFSTGVASIAAWIKPDANNGDANIVGISDNASGTKYRFIEISSGKLRVIDRTNTEIASAVQVGTVTAGAWQLVVAVFASNADRRCYLNTTKVTDTTSMTLPTTCNRFNVGSAYFSGAISAGQQFKGRVGEVAVWNTALTDADVAAIVNGQRLGDTKRTSLVGWWKMRTNTSPEPDSIGSNSLTVTGAAYSSDEPPAYSVDGVTRDANGAALASCLVKMMRTSDDEVIDSDTSDGSGNYSIIVSSGIDHYAVAYKDGTPDVAGTSVNTLQGAL